MVSKVEKEDEGEEEELTVAAAGLFSTDNTYPMLLVVNTM